jgi:predicted regulator of Ras-like GTPase activity (Roadblock/LC7/MglB family)
MDFSDVLKRLVDNVKGGMAGTIMAKDGIAIHNYVKDKAACDIDSLGAEYARILEETKNVSATLKLGEIEELSIMAKGSTVIMRLINQDYFITLVLGSNGSFGKARYLVKRAVSAIRKEF